MRACTQIAIVGAVVVAVIAISKSKVLCRFKHALGKPKEGVHKLRLGGVAIVDVIGMVLIIVLIQSIFKMGYLKTSAIVIGGTIAIHAMFCVDTAVNVALFGKKK